MSVIQNTNCECTVSTVRTYGLRLAGEKAQFGCDTIHRRCCCTANDFRDMIPVVAVPVSGCPARSKRVCVQQTASDYYVVRAAVDEIRTTGKLAVNQYNRTERCNHFIYFFYFIFPLRRENKERIRTYQMFGGGKKKKRRNIDWARRLRLRAAVAAAATATAAERRRRLRRRAADE